MVSNIRPLFLFLFTTMLSWSALIAQSAENNSVIRTNRQFISTPGELIERHVYRRFKIKDLHLEGAEYIHTSSDRKRQLVKMSTRLGEAYNHLTLEIYMDRYELEQVIVVLTRMLDNSAISEFRIGDGYSYVTLDGMRISSLRHGSGKWRYYISLDPYNPEVRNDLNHNEITQLKSALVNIQKIFEMKSK